MTVASAVCAAVYYYARRTKQCTDLAVFLQLEMIGIVFVFMTWLSEQATVPLGALVCFCVVLLLVVCRVHWVFLLISTMITFFALALVIVAVTFSATAEITICDVQHPWLAFCLAQCVTVFVTLVIMIIAPFLITFGIEELRGFSTLSMAGVVLLALERLDLSAASFALQNAANDVDPLTCNYFTQIVSILRTYREHLPHAVAFPKKSPTTLALEKRTSGDMDAASGVTVHRICTNTSSSNPTMVTAAMSGSQLQVEHPQQQFPSQQHHVLAAGEEIRATVLTVHFTLPDSSPAEEGSCLARIVDTIVATIVKHNGVVERGTSWNVCASFGVHYPVVLHEQAAASCARSLVATPLLAETQNFCVTLCTGYVAAVRYASEQCVWVVVGGSPMQLSIRLGWLQRQIGAQILANTGTARALQDVLTVDLILCPGRHSGQSALDESTYIYEVARGRRPFSDKLTADMKQAFTELRTLGKTNTAQALFKKWSRESSHAERMLQALSSMPLGAEYHWLEAPWNVDGSGGGGGGSSNGGGGSSLVPITLPHSPPGVAVAAQRSQRSINDSSHTTIPAGLREKSSDEQPYFIGDLMKSDMHAMAGDKSSSSPFGGGIVLDSEANRWHVSAFPAYCGRTVTIHMCLSDQGLIRAAQVQLHADPERAFRQVELIRNLQHDHLLRCYSSVLLDDRPAILCDYFPQGSLKEFLEQYGLLHVSTWKNFLRDVLSALHFLHCHNQVHGGIRPSCLLVGDDGTCTLGGFAGLSRFDLEEHAWFAAPEQLRGQPRSKATDIWSLGATAIRLIYDVDAESSQPSNFMKVRQALVHGTLPNWTAPQYVTKFILRCIEPDPSKRAPTEELLALI